MPQKFPHANIQKRHGANLPHWTSKDAIYSVTFRLGDSLPQPILDEYKRKRDFILAAYKDTHRLDADAPYEFTRGDLQQLQALFSVTIERHLDAGLGNCWMNRPAIADLIQNALFHFHQQRYSLHAWAVMPNHVHTIFQPIGGYEISSILHSWKSYTAKEANKVLVRNGEFWQAESFDHLIRNQQDYDHCMKYTLENPASAGLRDWRWVGTTAQHRRDADATIHPLHSV